MNVDEALLLADSISADQLGGKGALSALVLLAAEVRRQHAEIERMQPMVDALDGLPPAAIVGGWTFKGFTRWAQGLEADKSRLQKLCETAPRWVPVGERLPERCRTVLACYINRAGMLRRIRAHWIPAKTVEACIDDECSEYDEDADTHWTPEGWYEQIDNWGDYSAVAVCEGTVTHWMPLPPPPQGA